MFTHPIHVLHIQNPDAQNYMHQQTTKIKPDSPYNGLVNLLDRKNDGIKYSLPRQTLKIKSFYLETSAVKSVCSNS